MALRLRILQRSRSTAGRGFSFIMTVFGKHLNESGYIINSVPNVSSPSPAADFFEFFMKKEVFLMKPHQFCSGLRSELPILNNAILFFSPLETPLMVRCGEFELVI